MLTILNKIKKDYGINHCIKYSNDPFKFKYCLLNDLNKITTHFEKYYYNFKKPCSKGNICNQLTFQLNNLEEYINNLKKLDDALQVLYKYFNEYNEDNELERTVCLVTKNENISDHIDLDHSLYNIDFTKYYPGTDSYSELPPDIKNAVDLWTNYYRGPIKEGSNLPYIIATVSISDLKNLDEHTPPYGNIIRTSLYSRIISFNLNNIQETFQETFQETCWEKLQPQDTPVKCIRQSMKCLTWYDWLLIGGTYGVCSLGDEWVDCMIDVTDATLGTVAADVFDKCRVD